MPSRRAIRRRSRLTSWWKRARSRSTCRIFCSDARRRSRHMRCLYLTATERLATVDDPRLDATTERHKIALTPTSSDWQGPPIHALERDPGLPGLIIEIDIGWVGSDRLLIARAALRRGRRVWGYWPREQAIECVDRERIGRLWRR